MRAAWKKHASGLPMGTFTTSVETGGFLRCLEGRFDHEYRKRAASIISSRTALAPAPLRAAVPTISVGL